MYTIDQIYYGLRNEVKAKSPALAELITQAAASFEVKSNMCEAALKGELTADNFKEKHGKLLPESHKKEQLRESAAPLGLENIDEAKRDYAVLFGVEPRVKATNKESKQPIRKHNGTADNFDEANPFNGERSRPVTENNTQKDVCTKGDKALLDGFLKLRKITEAEHSKLIGNKPEGYNQLTGAQRKEFDFVRMVGLTEADAFNLVKITGGYKEVSH